jgi:putative tricarboxylic transport membrane protein
MRNKEEQMVEEKKSKQGENPIPSGILMVFGLAVALGSLSYQFGSFANPGAGFLPFFAGAIIAVLSAVTFFQNLKKRFRPLGELWKGVQWQRPALVSACLLIYAFFMRDLGFVISTFIVMTCFFRVLEPPNWKVTLAAAATTTIAFVLVFRIWLSTQLPRGLLGF